MIYPARLAPLIEGVAARQALSRTAQVMASPSPPGGQRRPAAPDRTGAFNADVAATLAAAPAVGRRTP